MEGGAIIGYIFLFVFVAIAVICDIKTYCIPNRVNIIGCITGLIMSAICNGMSGVGMSLVGVVVPTVGLFVLFAHRIVGAGDIKLLSAIGSFVGLDVIKIVIVALIITAIYGVYIVMLRVIGLLREYFKVGLVSTESCTVGGFTKIHLSVPIMLATVIIELWG